MNKYNICNCGNKKKDSSKKCSLCAGRLTKDRGLRTKGSYLKQASNWWEARVPIAKHARKVFYESSKNKVCINCGYDKHIEVCHINPVSDFPNESTLYEINNINNLIALCRNCHWEFDNKILTF